ncbi:MAG: Calx-beta domain-containing protein [Pseudomonadota bacterium]
MTSLYLYDNQLTGSIPSQLDNLSNLEFLSLSDNKLCGEIPVELKNLSNISSLKLDNNHLTASDSELIAWLDSHNPGWKTTQTSCPAALFLLTRYSVTENGGQVSITVIRVGNGAISVNYATTDGTATAGSDYIQSTGTLSWADGDSTNKTITITIIDDDTFENSETFINPETFTITLTSPINGAILDNATIIINENDPFDCTAVTEIPSTECEVLVALYNSTDGPILYYK